MGQKKTPGLVKRNSIWHVDKCIDRRRICKSTGSARLEEAERFLARLREEARQAEIYGVRPTRTFEQAATKYVLENQHKRSIDSDVGRLKQLIPWIGSCPLERLHRGSLETWIEQRRKDGVSIGTINHGLKVVRMIMNLAAAEWMDEHGLTWIQAAPKFKLLPDVNKRQPYPLSWDEQAQLFKLLPDHLATMALFTVNTGCRDSEVCNLQWDWEVAVPTMETSVFIIPATRVKNADERLVILNSVARSVISEQRCKHPKYVFVYRGKPIQHMLNNGWRKAREALGLPQVRVHDLKHTFGRRLRAAGVSFEDRQDLLGHRSGRITTHYSAAELPRLIEVAKMVCECNGNKPELGVLQRLNIA
ncbi:MAG: tyrosine-type recombinase/integrase [Pseudomonadales bacterium]|nr:tyrosine-type recombinase/integrase [Pseudomonadales bacterium]